MRLFTIFFIAVNFLWSSVDINNASIKELTKVKGIGSKTFEKTYPI
jgi:DNA uptake protein ComE-like DNA-binding protein